MRLDRTFLGEYELGVGEWPGGHGDRMFWYPGASTVGGRDGVLLEFSPASGLLWLGVFAPMLTSPRGVAVLSNGAVYRVAADDPREWEEISVGGVMDPVVVEEFELVLFVDHTTAFAYGRDGLAWESEQLAWDDLQAFRLEGDVLHLEGFDARLNEIVAFTLDVRTGRSPDAPHPQRRLRRVN